MRILLTCLLLLTCTNALASGDFGLGFVIGSPTGITGLGKLSDTNAVDGTLGWALSEQYFQINLNYLWIKSNIFKNPKAPFDLHYGIGGRLRGSKETRLGPRFPVGLSHFFRDPPIEVYFEVAPVINLITRTDLDIDVGLGGRFYF